MRRHAMFFAFFLVCLPSLCLAMGNETNDSFSRARKMLERQVYHDHRITIYCEAPFDAKKNIVLPDGFRVPERFAKRAKRVEWEHAVPAENFGRAFPEWREGHPLCVDNRGNPFRGRNCAGKVNMRYRLMEADMHNLFPAIGAVNAERSNKRYAMLSSSDPDFGSCRARYSKSAFEPPAKARGILARAALYMELNYPEYELSSSQKRLFEAWSRQYPVDAWECERTRRIARLQGDTNEFTEAACHKAGL